MARKDCPACDGTGFVVSETERPARAVRCHCELVPRRTDLSACGIPRRYLHCTLESYRPDGVNQREAVAVAREFVLTFPAVDRGILFTGSCGTGKTHLAVAILRRLVLEQGVQGVFADYQDLLKRIQASWRPSEAESEEGVLAPVLEADLLVLDDLGSRRSTAWAEETIGHVLNVRYNAERTTIITTNLLENVEVPVASGRGQSPPGDQRTPIPGDQLLLSERVPERVLSRIYEMCRTVTIWGEDYRRRRARPARGAGRQPEERRDGPR